jgi:DNA-directed RNA polymerase subunit omega
MPMARVTVEDCLEKVPNRFALIHLAFQRVKMVRAGAPPRVQSKNKEVVQALREIAAGKVTLPPGFDLAFLKDEGEEFGKAIPA